MKEQTVLWLKKAEDDYRVALLAAKASPPLYDGVCFHAQQCVEKYLKGLLHERGIEVPRSHDLSFLARFGAPEVIAMEKMEEELAKISSFAVSVRYPEAGAGQPEADYAVDVMKRARRVIRKALFQGGKRPAKRRK